MAIPYREFDGEPGDWSVDTQGPVYIQKDLDKLFSMFNPASTLPDGTPGGIKEENLNFDANLEEYVDDWLDDHPEASTTVQDGSITKAKLNDEVSDDAVEMSYYDEITYTIERINNESDVYIVTIPLNDSDNNLIQTYVGYSYSLSPLEYAQENGTTFTMNNCISMKPADDTDWLTGNIIGNGVVLNSQNITKELVSKGIGYLTISEDRQVIKDYPITTTLATLQADPDVYQCMTYYCKLVEDGEPIDITGIVSNEGKAFATNSSGVGMFIGVTSNKTLIVAGNEGRTEINKGALPTDVADLLVEKGCTDVWLMDGGGSSNITIRGSKLNRNYDENGTKDRNIHYTLNVRKPTLYKSVTDCFAQIGEEKQRLIQQLVPAINFEADRFETEDGTNLNTISTTCSKYIIHATNQPTGASAIGHCVTICRTDDDTVDNWQMWIPYNDAGKLFIRNYYSGSWKDWIEYRPPLHSGDEVTTDISFYSACTSGDKIYVTIPCGNLYKTGTNSTAVWGEREDAGINILMNGSRIDGLQPTIGFVRPHAHIGFYVRFDVGSDLTDDPNYEDDCLIGVSIRDLHITV